MYHKDDLVHYESLEQLWARGYRSERFQAAYDPASFEEDKPLSERLQFTQSNARVLLGQDTAARLAFVCAPHERDYGIPTCVTGAEYPITAHPGMYYQTDMALWYGRARFRLELSGGRALDAAGPNSVTWYADHFLPVTRTELGGLTLHAFSVAPVMEPGARCAIPGTQLPGPSGALFALHIANTSGEPVRGRCRLLFEREFVIRSEYDGAHFFEEDAVPAYRCEWERDIYTMWRPDACASVHLKGARHNTDADTPELYVELALAPGASRTVECRVAVAPDKRGVAPALAALFQHDALGWVNITRRFWAERLGDWSCGIEGDAALARAYRDLQIRNVLDNFNCLQTDADGRLLVHWQGAPSHNMGRFWGIDFEPTAISVLYAVPELGPSLLMYIAGRNEPRYSAYPDHSTPIRVALLSVAGVYFRLTNDLDCFKNNPALARAMAETFDRLMATKHADFDLFPSRYSSDGIVFHRYDLGTNAKVFFALKEAHALLGALDDPRALQIPALLEGIRRGIRETMVADGPFGAQFTGGNNLGEAGGFYFRDDLFYYDGEDSSSCMIPVYGMSEFDSEPWRNYHRFARSLFATNYDPEMGALRWFFYGGAVDGTAYVSRLGGSVTRGEMSRALTDMLERAVDHTGSLFWWPRGVNKRRCIARCSQGQGSWVLQGTEQWLGLRYDAIERELVIRPQGLLDGYRWLGARLGAGMFDVEWGEPGGEARLRLVNRNGFAVRVRVGVRPRGAGADGELAWHRFTLEAGESLDQAWAQADASPCPDFLPEARELELLGRDGLVFGAFGLHLPSAEPANAFLLRFVLLSGEPLHDVRLELDVPDGFGVMAKQPLVWDVLPARMERSAVQARGAVAPRAREVFPFYVRLPDGLDGAQVWQSAHAFEFPVADPGESCLYVPAQLPAEFELAAALHFTAGGRQRRLEKRIKLRALDRDEFDRAVSRILREPR